MNKETKKALEGSIIKWRKIVNYLRYKRKSTSAIVARLNVLEQGSKNCPLCKMFVTCVGCPVTKKTEKTCIWTPYGDFATELRSYRMLLQGLNLDELRYHARRELKFLVSLMED